MPTRCPLHDPIPVETQQPRALSAFAAVLDPLGIEAARKVERERALLAQMAATILGGQLATTNAEHDARAAVAMARAIIAEIDKERSP